MSVAPDSCFDEAGPPRLSSTPVSRKPRVWVGNDIPDTQTPASGCTCLVEREDLVESMFSDKETLMPSMGDVGRGHTITNTCKDKVLPSNDIACAASLDMGVSLDDTHHHHHPAEHPPPPQGQFEDNPNTVEEVGKLSGADKTAMCPADVQSKI